MAKWQKLLLGLLVAVMVWLAAATWGSIGSAVMVLCLISAVSAILWRRFVLSEESDIYE